MNWKPPVLMTPQMQSHRLHCCSAGADRHHPGLRGARWLWGPPGVCQSPVAASPKPGQGWPALAMCCLPRGTQELLTSPLWPWGWTQCSRQCLWLDAVSSTPSPSPCFTHHERRQITAVLTLDSPSPPLSDSSLLFTQIHAHEMQTKALGSSPARPMTHL